MANFDGTDDTFDSREVLDRIAELTAEFVDTTETDPADWMSADDWAFGLGQDAGEELEALIALKEEAANDIADFEYGETFVSDDYFEDYARELAEDLGMIPEHAEWPANYIDWAAAADALKMDYTSFEFRGTTYWAR